MDNKKPTGIYFETKKQPFDIKIDNNKKEPKLSKNVRYSDKQNYRRYKSLTEPKLLSRIMVDANDSETLQMQAKIQEILGIAPKKEPERIITAPSGYVAPPTGAPAPEPEAAMASASARAPEPRAPEPEDPWAGYTFRGDLGRISTGLFDGLSAINDISVDDQIQLTGAMIPEDKSIASMNSEDRDLMRSFQEDIDHYNDLKAMAEMTPLDLLKNPQGKELMDAGLFDLFDTPAETKLKQIRQKSAARTIEDAYIRKLDRKMDSSTLASAALTEEATGVAGATPVAKRTRSRKARGRTLNLD